MSRRPRKKPLAARNLASDYESDNPYPEQSGSAGASLSQTNNNNYIQSQQYPQQHQRQKSQQYQHQRQQSQNTSKYDTIPAKLPISASPRPERTNDEMNLTVLRRYLPSITSIPAIAASANLYTFSTDKGKWERADMDGPIFLCHIAPPSTDDEGDASPTSTAPTSKYCVFLLNRRSLVNLILDLSRVSACEFLEEILMFHTESQDALVGIAAGSDAGMNPPTIGMWIHEGQEPVRMQIVDTIMDAWKEARAERVRATEAGMEDAPIWGGGGGAGRDETDGGTAGGQEQDVAAGPAMQALGRKLSLSELFGRAGGVTDTEGAF